MDQISEPELRIYRLLSTHADTWFSNVEIAVQLKPIALRTVRAHTKAMFEKGMLEKVHVFPGDRFRFRYDASKDALEDGSYLRRLGEAAQIFEDQPKPGPRRSRRTKRGEKAGSTNCAEFDLLPPKRRAS